MRGRGCCIDTSAAAIGLSVGASALTRLTGLWIAIGFVGQAVAIVVVAVGTAGGGVFGGGGGRDAIAPQKFGQRRGLGFLLAPLARADFLQKLAEAELALAFGSTAQSGDAGRVDAVAFVLEVAAITRLGALQAAGVVICRLDAVDAVRRSATGHYKAKQHTQK